MPLEQEHQALVAPFVGTGPALAAVGFGLCWPNDSGWSQAINISVNSGEQLDEAAHRLDLAWSPRWLVDAGHEPLDAQGYSLLEGAMARSSGPISWTPTPRLPRVDDQTGQDAGVKAKARRTAGEVAVAALWRNTLPSEYLREGFDIRPDGELDRNTRGARFKDFLVYVLSASLPDGWRVEPEVFLTHIRGLHMRKDVGKRRSDIAVIDDGNRLVAVISSKFTWRSDRGTEAAQMVPLKQYRPDVPYAMVTAEYVRVRVVARESIEDSVYHLCPGIAGAWRAIYDATSPRTAYPSLAQLEEGGKTWVLNAGLSGLPELVADLRKSGTIL